MAREMPPPYRKADAAQAALVKKARKRLDDEKRRLNIFGFDELNVLRETDALYEGLFQDVQAQYRILYIERYLEVLEWLEKPKPSDDFLTELVELWLIGFLKEPNENTNYAFDSEFVRKRDRAKEAVNSVPTKAQKQLQLEKAVRIALQQDSWYTDMASQAAELQAYKDAGVKRVRWQIYGDDKVCEKCENMNGNVYDIDKVPKRPHLKCRCYLVPVN